MKTSLKNEREKGQKGHILVVRVIHLNFCVILLVIFLLFINYIINIFIKTPFVV